MAPERLVLWDIDHTLMDTRGVGRELSALAFQRTTGLEMRRQAAIDGITEAVIFRETAKLHGLATSRQDFERFADALAEAHRVHSVELRSRGQALPGAASLLDRLASLPGLVQTVVSGNVRSVAQIKLVTFDLDRHVLWEIGAFGEDAEERPDLVRTALSLATRYFGLDSAPFGAVVVGDTPADVQSGLAAGVPVIAVATGHSSQSALREAGAVHVVTDLTDTDRLVQLISSVAERDQH